MDGTVQSFFGGASGLILFLLGFSFIIFVHELGHFLVARMAGIKCTQFAIGMGHAVFSFRKGMGFRFGSSEPEFHQRVDQWINDHERELGDRPDYEKMDRACKALGLGLTEYRLSALPLGGYVKMVGQEDLNPDAASSDPNAYNQKPVPVRMAVISAGVIMNMIFAFLFFVIAFMVGVNFPPAIVGGVVEDMPAATTYAQGHEDDPEYRGLEPGDRIVQVDERETLDFGDVMLAAALGQPDEPAKLVVERDQHDTPLVYRMAPVKAESPVGPKLLAFGIEPPLSLKVAVEPGSRLHRAGVRHGMIISAVEGESVDEFHEYEQRVTAARGRPVQVTFTDPRSGESATAPVSAVAAMPRNDQGVGNLLGLLPATRILQVLDDAPAAHAGVQPGDVIAAVNAIQWPSIEQLKNAIENRGDRPVTLTVLREQQEHRLEPITPNRKNQIGVLLARATNLPIVSDTVSGGPTDDLLTAGSKILALNDEPVEDFSHLQRRLVDFVEQNPEGGEVRFTYQLNIKGEPIESRTLELSPEDARNIRRAAWYQTVNVYPLEVPILGQTPLDALALGFRKTHQVMLQTYVTLLRLFQGTVKVGHLKGPVGIIEAGTVVANERGVTYLLFFLGVLSVNLAVLNFLPLPIVDGGHMVLLLIEKLKGTPVSAGVQAAVTYVGLAVIAVLFLVVTYNDISNFIRSL